MAAADKIPGQIGVRAPAAAEPDWRTSTELGRNTNNALNAMGGIGAVTRAPAGLRALGSAVPAAAADAGIYVNGAGQASKGGVSMARALMTAPEAAPVVAGAGYGVPNAAAAGLRTAAGFNAAEPEIERARGALPKQGAPFLPDMPTMASGPAAQPQGIRGALPTGVAPGVEGAGRGFGSTLRANPVPQNDVPTGWTTRDVNGAAGVRRMTTGDGRTLYTNVVGDDNAKLMSNKPGLQIAPAFNGGNVPGAGAAPAAPQVVPGAGLSGIGGTRREDDLRARMTGGTIAELAASGKLTAGGLSAVVQAQGQEMSNRATLRGQDMGQQNAQMQDATQRYTADQNAQVSLRGQDMSRGTAQMQARMQQMQQDRQFGLDVAKFGQDQAKTMFEQRAKGEKDFHDWAGSLFTTKDDKGNTVQDDGAKSEFVRTASMAMGGMISALKQKGDPASLAKAEKLAQGGFGSLDAEDKATLKTLFDRRQRFIESRGSLEPGSASGAISDNLMDYHLTGDDSGLFQKRLKMAGGQSIGDSDLRYTEQANTFLPDWFKTPTTALGPTINERAALKGVR